MVNPQQTSTQSSGKITIPDELRTKHPELIELILGSESMNDEERQYWVNILPIMTPEQVENLRGILLNEKRQLAAIEKKYSKEVHQIEEAHLVQTMEEDRRKRRSERKGEEQKYQNEEETIEEDILQQINEA